VRAELGRARRASSVDAPTRRLVAAGTVSGDPGADTPTRTRWSDRDARADTHDDRRDHCRALATRRRGGCARRPAAHRPAAGAASRTWSPTVRRRDPPRRKLGILRARRRTAMVSRSSRCARRSPASLRAPRMIERRRGRPATRRAACGRHDCGGLSSRWRIIRRRGDRRVAHARDRTRLPCVHPISRAPCQHADTPVRWWATAAPLAARHRDAHDARQSLLTPRP
jgi:hypothetical protein